MYPHQISNEAVRVLHEARVAEMKECTRAVPFKERRSPLASLRIRLSAEQARLERARRLERAAANPTR
jgi:hypothetical protein